MDAKTIFLPKTMLDSHCHGRDMRQKQKTTVRQTLKEALKGSIGITVFMPNTDPPIIDLNTLSLYLGLIGEARISLGLKNRQYVYFGVTDGNLTVCDDALKCDSVIGLKIYPKGVTTGSGGIGICKPETVRLALNIAARHGKVVAVHCDDPEIIATEGHTKRAEVSYLNKVLGFLREVPKAKVVICHVSCQESAMAILLAQQEGLQIAMEICPHYLWFDSEGSNWNDDLDPVFYHCYNPLRTKSDRHYLKALLLMKNPLIFIGSDNAPHTGMEKLLNKLGGLPTNQEMVAVIATLSLRLNISEEQLVGNILCYNAAEFLGIPVPKGKKKYWLIKKIDDIKYNNGAVVNPWAGSELYFPVPINEEEMS